ncbi:uncharacterized protein LOC116805634 isoform X2 [Drosophila grimshawi]|uniref:uncharacterized protein LOC116805634 isoform X2 n=1 Tax=Drosophila grimshawi TaxID=7222 RepID=UPI000C86E5BC|nr:uncharacterized protein LOC116805634 isoform X2 [Drosophila grimshawi]
MGFVYTQLVHAHAWKQFVYFSEESRQSSQFELNSTSGIPNYGNSRRHGSSYLRQQEKRGQPNYVDTTRYLRQQDMVSTSAKIT